jgi:hypothetical protein
MSRPLSRAASAGAKIPCHIRERTYEVARLAKRSMIPVEALCPRWNCYRLRSGLERNIIGACRAAADPLFARGAIGDYLRLAGKRHRFRFSAAFERMRASRTVLTVSRSVENR